MANKDTMRKKIRKLQRRRAASKTDREIDKLLKHKLYESLKELDDRYPYLIDLMRSPCATFGNVAYRLLDVLVAAHTLGVRAADYQVRLAELEQDNRSLKAQLGMPIPEPHRGDGKRRIVMAEISHH